MRLSAVRFREAAPSLTCDNGVGSKTALAPDCASVVAIGRIPLVLVVRPPTAEDGTFSFTWNTAAEAPTLSVGLGADCGDQ